MQQEYKYLVKDITISAGSSAGTNRIGTDITAGYERVIGIAVNEQANGGVPFYKIGFSDDNKTYIDPIPANLMKVDQTVKMADRFIDVDMPGNNNKIYTDLVLPTSPGTDFKFQVVFKVLKGLTNGKC